MQELGQLTPLLPQIAVAAAAVVAMVLSAIRRSGGITFAVACAGLGAALACLLALPGGPATVTALFVVDGLARFFTGLILLTALAVLVLSAAYTRGTATAVEYGLLLLLATLGALVLVASRHFAAFLLGLELLSVSLYALIAWPRDRAPAVEAALKYLILAGFSSALLFFGMALIYVQTGTLAFDELARRLAVGPSPLVLGGLALLIVGIGFKLAVAPFHMWTPDVYQAAPAPVTAYIATVSKGAVLVLLVRFAGALDLTGNRAAWLLFAGIAVVSMFAGNLLALRQESLKRLLACSSIAHLGYILVAFLAGEASGNAAIAFYLVAYTVMTLGAFGVITVLSGHAGESDCDELAEYRGLGRRRPWLSGVLAAMLFSLAGIPLTAGFIGKFVIVKAGLSAGHVALVLVLVVNSAISVYYYLRVIVAMYLRGETPGERPIPAQLGRTPLAGAVTLAVLVLALLWLGIAPSYMLQLVADSFRGML